MTDRKPIVVMQSDVIVEHECIDTQVVLVAWYEESRENRLFVGEYSTHLRLVPQGAFMRGVYFNKDSLESATSSFINRCRHYKSRVLKWWDEPVQGL